MKVRLLFFGVMRWMLPGFLILSITGITGCYETGVFLDSPVAGLSYSTTVKGQTVIAQTNEDGTFLYNKGQTLTFSIGTLTLGTTSGKSVVTPLDLVPDATGVSDQRVVNMCVLLQTLDQDGDLNNGIQITKAIADIVSAAGVINFNQTTKAFAADPAVKGLLAALNAASPAVFTDKDPRPRTLRGAQAAQEHFVRSTSERVVVMTKSGALKGYAANADAWQFLGIPYAKPPLGNLRWKPPQPPEPWKGVRDAIAWSDQAAQNPVYQSIGEGGMSEDCLYLNVTAPKHAHKLPVMVWFHGGAFTILTSNSKQYNNPAGLTEKGVVLVTVNHRLGPFGYLAHPLLAAESTYGGSGNYGQMDLVMALEWVQKNIKAFGGDPRNVTIFGQSGGGGKVNSLMNSPMAKGLFHKAICQSGMAPADPTATNESAIAAMEAVGISMFNRLGVTSLEQARALPWTTIVQSDIAAGIPREIYRPTIDYYYMSKTYYQTLLDGLPGDVPFIVGVTDGDYPSLKAAMPAFMVQRTPYYKSKQYAYKFSRVPDGWAAMGLQSGHGGEIPYLFNFPMGLVSNYTLGLVLTPAGTKPPIGDLNGNGISGTAGDTEDIYTSMNYGPVDDAFSDLMMTLWTNFAKTGDPSTKDLIWTPYTSASDAYLSIGPAITEVKTGLVTAFP
jgi:para-nitrobenzyl esterase